MFHNYCFQFGQYEGTQIYLYGNDGEGIRNEKTLKNVLNKWDSKDYEDLDVFVVPCDCHS